MSKAKWVLAAVVFAVLATGGFAYYKHQSKPVITYREVPVARGDIQISILSTGAVAPENKVEIKSPVAGRAEKVLVKEGEKVKKGQVLVWMSSADRAALIDAATSKGPEELKRWEAMYLETPVLAPINGTIIARNVESGQSFSTTDSILTMSDRLTVKAQVDETDIAQIKVRQEAVITLDAYPGETIEASVDKIAYDATTTNNVTTYFVDVLPKQTPEFMRSGMTANVTFFIQDKKDVLTIPTEAIQNETNVSPEPSPDDQSAHVLVKNQKGLPEERLIKLGITDGKKAEVLSGLAQTDVVMIKQVAAVEKNKMANPFMPTRPKRSGGSHP
jgi:macrolide-specific efflux system membrane fusion protein